MKLALLNCAATAFALATFTQASASSTDRALLFAHCDLLEDVGIDGRTAAYVTLSGYRVDRVHEAVAVEFRSYTGEVIHELGFFTETGIDIPRRAGTLEYIETEGYFKGYSLKMGTQEVFRAQRRQVNIRLPGVTSSHFEAPARCEWYEPEPPTRSGS